jgi:Flp pilus assembly protein TadG
MTTSIHSWRWRASSPTRRRDPSRGGAAVEFALVLPIFMLLVMGALDYGYFFFSDQVVAGAAREGARAGTMVDPAQGTTAATNAAQAAAYAYMKGNGIDCPTNDDSCVHATIVPVPPLNAVSVLINYQFTSLTGYSSVVTPKFINGSAVMRWQ